MRQLLQRTRAALGLGVVVAALAFSVASTPGGTDPEGTCGAIDEDLGAEGDVCEMREDCNEVCCLCDNGDFGFVAQGCNLDDGTCYGGDQVCQLALADDPSLCGDGEPEDDAGPS
jgi:hypothetical protein